MRPSEVRELVQLRRPELDPTRRLLAASFEIEDLRQAARRRLPRAVFGYVDGAAGDETAMVANCAAFGSWRFTPRHLVDVASVDTSTEVLGSTLAYPIGLAPTGYTAMIHPDAEPAAARAASSRQVLFSLATMGTTSIEDLAATGASPWWFQLYALRQPEGRARQLVARAAAAGAAALVVTVDTPTPSDRLRDLRNGLTIPPRLSLSAVVDIGLHPGYWARMLRRPPLRFANVSESSATESGRLKDQFNPSLTWESISELRRTWPRALLVKGPLGPDDARRALDAGCDGIYLSNHGGRQLDRCIAPLELLPRVRAAVGGSVPIVLDSGIRSGADVALALALGADLCMVGRPYLYGLAAAGEQGVAKVIDLLAAGLTLTMRLLGVTSLDELRKEGPTLAERA